MHWLPASLRRRLLLLREVDRLPLEHVQQRLRRLEDLHVRGLRFLDRLVVLVPRLRAGAWAA